MKVGKLVSFDYVYACDTISTIKGMKVYIPISPKRFHWPFVILPSHTSLPTLSPSTLWSLSLCINLHFLESVTVKSYSVPSFSSHFTHKMILRFTHVTVCIKELILGDSWVVFRGYSSFFFFFMNSPVDGHLVCL